MNPIKATSDILDVYRQLKIDRKLKCIIFKLTNGQLEVDLTKDTSFNFNELADVLPAKEGRFVIVDFEYETDEVPARKVDKIIMISWAPMTAPPMQRFSYSSGATTVANELGAISRHFQASDLNELDYETFRKELLKK